jgi:hypothetical protein
MMALLNLHVEVQAVSAADLACRRQPKVLLK